MADYGPGYDPSQADYTNPSGYVSPNDQAIGGLIGIAAFAAIGVLPLFAEAAVVAGTAPGAGVVVAEGTVIPAGVIGPGQYIMAQETALFLQGASATITAEEGAAAVAAVLESGELASQQAQFYLAVMLATEAEEAIAPSLLKTFTVESLIGLSNYSTNQNHFINIGGYGFDPNAGGDPSIPGFPGFLEGAHVVHGWHRVCVTIFTGDHQEPEITCWYEN